MDPDPEISKAASMFFFSSRRRHTRLQGDWSSDVCSSDLNPWLIPSFEIKIKIRIKIRIEKQRRVSAHTRDFIFTTETRHPPHTRRTSLKLNSRRTRAGRLANASDNGDRAAHRADAGPPGQQPNWPASFRSSPQPWPRWLPAIVLLPPTKSF